MGSKSPDVRVRLSAEGVAEVVNAFKRVQQEAEKTGKGGKSAASGLGLLKDQLNSLKSLLPALTIGAAVTGIVALGKRAIDTADGMGKLAQKTGFTVETISTLSFGARTAELEQEALSKALVKGAKFLDGYNSGASGAHDTIQKLIGSSKALQGQSQDQQLLKILDSLGKLGPGAKRTALAMEIFGKSGAQLLPLIDDLADGGFEKLRIKAQRLGLTLDENTTKAAQRAKDSMTDMESAMEGAALQLLSGLAPELADVAESISDSINVGGSQGIKNFGDDVGKVIKTIVAAFLIVGKTIGFMLEEAE